MITSRRSMAALLFTASGLLLGATLLLGLTRISLKGWDFDNCGTLVAPNPNAGVAKWAGSGNPDMAAFASQCSTAVSHRETLAAFALLASLAFAVAATATCRRRR